MFNVKQGYISPNIAPRGSECENNLYEVMSWDLFQVLNLIFDPCFKIKWGHHIKTSLLLILLLQNVKTDHEKSWPTNVFPVNAFGLILNNKMATIAIYFKSLRCSRTLTVAATFIKFAQKIYG